MEIIDNAGHAVLYSYGHFLDSLLLNIYNITKSFSPMNMLSNPIEVKLGEKHYTTNDQCILKDTYGKNKSTVHVANVSSKILTLPSIQLKTLQKEHVIIYDLIDMDNRNLSKILMAFSAICKEVEYLKNELSEQLLDSILQYGDNASGEMAVEEVYIMFAKFLPELLDILMYVRRCRHVLIHFLKQIFATIKFSWPKDSQNVMHLKLQEVFVYFSDLLLLFVTLDYAFNYNEENKISRHLSLFWQYIKLSSVTKEKSKTTKLLADINDELFTGSVFQRTIHTLFEEKVFLSNCTDFPNHFNRFLKKKINEIEHLKDNDICGLRIWGRVAVAHVFLTKSFGITDKKIHKSVQELSKKFIVVPLYGDLVWVPGNFMYANLDNRSPESNSRILAANSFFHQRRMEHLESNSSKDVKSFSFLVYKWSLQMENLMSIDASFSKLNGDIAELCIEGILISEQIKFSINNVLQLHGSSGCPMTKMSVLNICKLIELLKGIKFVFSRHHIEIGKQVNHTIQKRLIHILSTILRIKSDVFKSGHQEKYLDSYSSLLLTEKILYGSCSLDRILIMRLVLTVVNHYPLLDLDAMESIHKHINELHELCQLHEKLEQNSSVNLLFLEEDILPIYFKNINDAHFPASRLQYLLQSMGKDYTRTEYENHRKDLLQNKIIKELCEEIEVHLRLHAHAHLKDDMSLEKTNKNYSFILSQEPFSVYKWFITIKDHVESYLDETFYDLTTVALHDWQSYSEMKSLAHHQFKLESVEDNLPSQTVLQGLDVLEIMRNIHIFVSKYLYNLNTQCFVEYSSSNKHLNTIKIHQIANSIWTHGTGIMNTTVNFIYQFLRKKLLLCSQFLYDEHINSRLSKDLKYFLKEKLERHAMYPYERAEKFNKGISRLRLSSDGLSYLDQYRILISQIGNALGYVRMIRSGGLHHSISTVAFFPIMDYMNILEKPREPPLSSAVESFENIFDNAIHHLNIETDALKLLVEVFNSVFHTPENDHLRLFVMIIPPLTINFVHYIVTSKEKLSKRNSPSGIFTDDGFPMGIAYLLSVFNLNEEFDSLHWFESVYDKYESEINKLLTVNANQQKEELINDNTAQLSIKRLQVYKQEFELLHYNINSAKVFFSGEYNNKNT